MIKRVTIFAASSNNIRKSYFDKAYQLGQMLAENNIEIIYGGGNIGLMGSIADGSVSANGHVIGVIPRMLNDLELGHNEIKEMRLVETMHQREDILISESDAIVALPGGVGTFEELFQAIAWKLLGLIIKPIIILNYENYFDSIIKSLETALKEGFLRPEQKDLWMVFNNNNEVLEYLLGFKNKPLKIDDSLKNINIA